jgi:Domain of unknown function (DUF4375)
MIAASSRFMSFRTLRRVAILVVSGALLCARGLTTTYGDESMTIAQSASPDFEALRTLPLIEIITRATARYTLLLPETADRANRTPNGDSGRARAKIDGLDPAVRKLIWLTWLLDCWGPEKSEGLHTFFFLHGGDYANQVRDALFEAGLFKQDRLFRRAMAAFGPRYPVDGKVRESFFAWSQPATKVDATTSIPQPLNAFDMKIMALAKAFGSRDEYASALESFVRNNPTLRAWADEARDKISDEERLDWLVGRLGTADPEAMRERIATWPGAYRQLYLLDLFNSEMLNGGVHQFFLNSSGSLAREVVAALREADLPNHADSVEKGIAMFAQPYPVDRQVRGRYFFAHGETTEWDKKLDALTNAVDDGAIGATMLAIAKRADILPR